MGDSKPMKVFKIFLIIIGTLIMAFGNIAFLKPMNINSGGINGVGVIVMHFIEDQTAKDIAYNIVTYALTIGLWFVGFFFVSRKFAFKTLIASVVYPLATTLFTLVPGPKDLINGIVEILVGIDDAASVGTYILFGMISGTTVGFGVGITFLGGGSSGGVDVLSFLMEKYLNIKESVASFFVDGCIITSGLIILCVADANKYLLPCLTGILSVALTSIMIDLVYVNFNIVYQCDFISSEWEKISRYAQDVLGRGTTIIPIKGGYKLEDKYMVRCVLSRGQYNSMKAYLSKVDPKAFFTVAQTRTVFGEGFKINRKLPTINGK